MTIFSKSTDSKQIFTGGKLSICEKMFYIRGLLFDKNCYISTNLAKCYPHGTRPHYRSITDSWVSLWLSHLLMYGAKFWSVPRAPHVSSTIGASTVSPPKSSLWRPASPWLHHQILHFWFSAECLLECICGQRPAGILWQSPCSKNWKPHKIETKDNGIQAYYTVLQLCVGCQLMV